MERPNDQERAGAVRNCADPLTDYQENSRLDGATLDDASQDGTLPGDIENCLLALGRVREQFGPAACDLWTQDDSRHESRQTAADISSTSSGQTPSPLKIGRFEIVRELGGGAHGVVFLARDPVLRRTVALKVPRPEALLTTELRKRFVREAQIAGRLAHPNLLPVFEAGEAGPICYIASAYCDGPSLADWIASRTQPVSPRNAAELVADLADGVAYAHRQGVLHRDIKPSNVLLDRTVAADRIDSPVDRVPGMADGALTPRLTDFGLAKLLESTDDATHTGVLMGTPAYMAPEQATGRKDQIGPATDVYALGAILYELMTGLAPLAGSSNPDTLRRIVSEEPRPPRAARPEISRDLEAIVLKSLEKSPARRYLTAGELADDLRRYLHGEVTRARPLGTAQRGARWARRKPAAAVAITMTLIVIAVIAAGGAWHVSTLSTALEVATRAQADAEQTELELRQHYYAVDLKAAYEAWRVSDTEKAVEILERLKPRPGRRDLRGFLWRYLWWLCHGESRRVAGHKGPVYHLAYSADGKLLASGGADGAIRLWQSDSLRPLGLLKGDDHEISSLAFTPDGKLLASAGDTRVVRLWDVQAQSSAGILGTPGDGYANVAISPDGQTLAAAGKNPQVTLWDLPRRQRRAQLTGHRGSITCVTFSPDGRLLGTSSDDKTARIWNLDDLTCVHVFDQVTENIRCIAFSEDSREAIATGNDAIIHSWDCSSGKKLDEFRGHRCRVSAALFLGNGTRIVSAGEDQTLRVFQTLNSRSVRAFAAGQGRIWCLARSPRDDTVAAGGTDGTITFWNMADQSDRQSPPPRVNFTAGMAFTPESQLVSTLEPDGRIALSDLDRGTSLPLPAREAKECTWLRASADGSTLVSAHGGGVVRIWNLPAGTPRAVLPTHPGIIRSVALSDDGRLLATGTKAPDATSRVWDTRSGKLLGTLPNDGLNVYAQAFTRDTRHLIVGGVDKNIHVYNLNNFRRVTTLVGHQSDIFCLAISWDGRLLASGGGDNTVRLWSLESWRDENVVLRHPGMVSSVAFSPDEPILAAASGYTSLHFWHIPSGEELAVIRDRLRDLESIRFSPDGRWLASSCSVVAGDTKHCPLLWPAPDEP